VPALLTIHQRARGLRGCAKRPGLALSPRSATEIHFLSDGPTHQKAVAGRPEIMADLYHTWHTWDGYVAGVRPVKSYAKLRGVPNRGKNV
jgi:hypothetical protein